MKKTGLRLFKCRRGDFTYIDTVIGMFVIMLAVLLVLNVYSYFVLKQNLDYICDSLIETAAFDGEIGENLADRFEELCAETGLDPDEVTYSFDGSAFDSGSNHIQYGNLIAVSVSCRAELAGSGIFTLPLTVTAKASGLSEDYRK